MVNNRGAILVVVMVIMALSSLLAASLLFRMHAESAASSASLRGEQAYAAAFSGIRRAMTLAAGDDWYDNPELLKNQFVFDDGVNRWYFTVYAHDPNDHYSPRYGLSDHSGRIDLNAADGDALLALPNMTDELVDALLDYRDEDDATRAQGAEQDYYDQLEYPYLIPNGPFDSVEELLMVKGFTAAVVYGEDANLNGILDANEDDGDDSFPPDNRDGMLDRGLMGLLALDISTTNTDSQGRGRVNILSADREELEAAGLSEQTVRFILVVRREDEDMLSHPSGLLEAEHQLREDYEDLGLNAGDVIESGVAAAELPDVLDKLTCTEEMSLTGLVNVNTASAEVMAAMPEVDEYTAQRIVDYRTGIGVAERTTPAWLYTQNVLEATEFKRLAPRLTTRGSRFGVRSVGFSVPDGRFRVLEAVIDVSARRPRIVRVRDITRLGLPFVPDVNEIGRES